MGLRRQLDFLVAAASRPAAPASCEYPVFDVIVSYQEINVYHGTGVLLRRDFKHCSNLLFVEIAFNKTGRTLFHISSDLYNSSLFPVKAVSGVEEPVQAGSVFVGVLPRADAWAYGQPTASTSTDNAEQNRLKYEALTDSIFAGEEAPA